MTTMFNINNAVINNNLRKIPRPYLALKVPMSPRKDFEVYGQFGHVFSKSFASPDLGFGYFALKKRSWIEDRVTWRRRKKILLWSAVEARRESIYRGNYPFFYLFGRGQEK
jgi:Na+-transporting NADH:ubiquinone oxidoreductase subunit NqrF